MAKAKKNPVDLKRFTLEYVCDRREDIVEAAGDRNKRRDRYERYVNLDFFERDAGADEIRIALPIAFDTVNKLKALTFGRRWMVTVPSSGGPETKETDRAQKLERFLYGVTDRLGLYRHAGYAEQDALTMERGWIKAVYDAKAAEDEFPIRVTTPDPRTVYPVWDAGRERPTELIHTWQRARREIEAEWGVKLTRPLRLEDEDEWLDEEVAFSEWWKAETVEDVTEAKDDAVDAPKGSVEQMVEGMQNAAMLNPMPTADLSQGGGRTLGEAMAAQGLYEPALDGTRQSEDKGAVGKKRQKVRVRKIVHCAWVGEDAGEEGTGKRGQRTGGRGQGTETDAEWVKKPVVMVGYKAIPFFGWPGIGTPPSNKAYDGQSVLFALSAGDAPEGHKAMGVLQAMNLMASLMLDETVRRAHAPVQTTKKDGVVDLSPDAVNRLTPGESIGFVTPPPQTNDIPKSMSTLNQQINSVGLPEVMSGQVFNLSGQAISGLANAFEMVIADRQTEREGALRQLYSHILTLAREYADPEDGWEAYGDGAWGKFVNERVKPDEIGASTRVVVKLSSNMPKDQLALASFFISAWKQGGISWETFLDQFQKLFGLAADSPMDEIIRVMRDKLLMSDQMIQELGGPLAQEYGRLLRAGAGLPPAPPAPPAPVAPLAAQGTGNREQGAGPIPPGMATPDMVAAGGNLAGAMNMAGMLRN